jgi:hypothetical protein
MELRLAADEMTTVLASNLSDIDKWEESVKISRRFKHRHRDDAASALTRLYLISVMYLKFPEISFECYDSHNREEGIKVCYQKLAFFFTALDYYKNYHTQIYMECIEFMDVTRENYTQSMVYIEEYFGDRLKTDTSDLLGFIFFTQQNRNVNSSGLL